MNKKCINLNPDKMVKVDTQKYLQIFYLFKT